MKTPTKLYRHFDKDGVLLYVGISLCAVYRLSQHMNDAVWAPYIARIDIETYESREAALDAEREAITTEFPFFNTVHNGGRKEYGGHVAYSIGRRISEATALSQYGNAFRPVIEDGDEWILSTEVSKMLGTYERARHIMEPSAQHVVYLSDGTLRGGMFYWRRSDVKKEIARRTSKPDKLASVPYVRQTKAKAPAKSSAILIKDAKRDPFSALRAMGLDPSLFSKEEVQRLVERYAGTRAA